MKEVLSNRQTGSDANHERINYVPFLFLCICCDWNYRGALIMWLFSYDAVKVMSPHQWSSG